MKPTIVGLVVVAAWSACAWTTDRFVEAAYQSLKEKK